MEQNVYASLDSAILTINASVKESLLEIIVKDAPQNQNLHGKMESANVTQDLQKLTEFVL